MCQVWDVRVGVVCSCLGKITAKKNALFFAVSYLIRNFATKRKTKEKRVTMEVRIDRTHWYDRILAAFIFFTRLPLWRMRQPPRECYATVVEHWPLTGWLTGGVMALVLWFGPLLLPYGICVLLAIVARLLLTGGLHEDGLADFADGFGGGGGDRQRTLDIMKDSHIGTYGVLTLVVYALLLWSALSALPPHLAALTVLVGDPYAKMLAAQTVMMMPYARSAEQAKNRTVYRRMPIWASVGLAVEGLLPMALFLWWMSPDIEWQTVIFLPCLTMYALYRLIYSRLRGYTGDCCGAIFLLVELTVYLVVCCQATIA